MQRDIEFAIWCAKKCLHLWNAPDVVKEWLENPKPEIAKVAVAAWAAANTTWAAEEAAGAAANTIWAAGATWAAAEAVEAAAKVAEAAVEAAQSAEAAAWAAGEAAYAAEYAAKTLNTTVTELKLEYVKTWSMDELEHAEGDWIEFATVELFNRE